MRGFELYVTVIAKLRLHPMTATALHKVLHKEAKAAAKAKLDRLAMVAGERSEALAAVKPPCSPRPLRRLIQHLYHGGILRVAGWTKGQNIERIYGFAGGRPDAAPSTKGETLPRQLRHRMGHVERFVRAWEELSDPTSAQELADALGLSITASRHLLRAMTAERLCGIAGYDRARHPATALYRIGVTEDAPRKAPKSRADRYAREKERSQVRDQYRFFTFTAGRQE